MLFQSYNVDRSVFKTGSILFFVYLCMLLKLCQTELGLYVFLRRRMWIEVWTPTCCQDIVVLKSLLELYYIWGQRLVGNYIFSRSSPAESSRFFFVFGCSYFTPHTPWAKHSTAFIFKWGSECSCIPLYFSHLHVCSIQQWLSLLSLPLIRVFLS